MLPSFLKSSVPRIRRKTGQAERTKWARLPDMIVFFRRFAAGVFALAMLFGALAPGEVRAAPSASIVMDMRDGKVLKSSAADRRLHPASLTKMMTLYLAFEAVGSGRLRLDQKVRVSRHAARQPAPD